MSRVLETAANIQKNVYYGTLYAYSPETLPTAHRGTGNGIAIGLNRIMGILSAVIATVANVSCARIPVNDLLKQFRLALQSRFTFVPLYILSWPLLRLHFLSSLMDAVAHDLGHFWTYIDIRRIDILMFAPYI
jgi:hypothetical protein